MQFDPRSLLALNVIIAVMMYGAALSLRPRDFTRILRSPVAPAIGLLAQFVLLPALTCLAVWAGDIPAELALGMLLVACCPGGNFSNILTWLGRGNVATSVSMTAVSSLAATVVTPLNFAFYAALNPNTRPLVQALALDGMPMLELLLWVLAAPLVLGMATAHLQPALAKTLERPMRLGAFAILLLFVGIAFVTNAEVFRDHAGRIVPLAAAHNLAALCLGAAAAYAARLSAADFRAVTMEVGVQNTGLGLIILFNTFPDQAVTILLTAFWGVPHLVTGLGLVWFWSRRPVVAPAGSTGSG